jgi:beta-galactosidase
MEYSTNKRLPFYKKIDIIMINRSKTYLSGALLLTALLLSSCWQKAPENIPQRNNEKIAYTLLAEYRLGVSYYPEWWNPVRWDDDFRKMSELGLNTVRMGEFAWSALEPEEGKYSFAWMDSAINLAARYGIKTVLCTPTAAMPPWLSKKYPGVMTGNEYQQFIHSTRRCYSTENPDFIRLSENIVETMASHYGQNPHVLGWQIDNEPGSPISSKDKYMLSAYHRWLKEKFGSLDSLNKAWVGPFWSLNYTNWDQVNFPPETTTGFESHNHPGQELAYRQFFSDSYSRFIARQAEILGKRTVGQFITTNFPNQAAWSVNPFDANTSLDIASWDNYAQDPGVTGYHEQHHSSMNHDLARNASPTGVFLIAEQSTVAAAHAMQDKVRLQTYLNIAHGACGNIFFQWRPPLAGGESGYPSILELDGSFNKAETQFRNLGEEIPRIWPELKNTRTEATIAHLFTYNNSWSDGQFRSSSLARYEWESARYYRGLKLLKQNFDVIDGRGNLDRYKLVVAPNLEIVPGWLAEKLEKFVRNGGILVLNKGAGKYDEHKKLREQIAPACFSAMAGIKVRDKINVSTSKRYPGMKPEDVFEIHFQGKSMEPLSTMEWIELEGSRAIATFSGGRYEGRPAITLNKYHDGHVIYVATDCQNYALYDELGVFIAKEFNLKPLIEAPADVEVVSRVSKEAEYIFLLNFSENSYDIPLRKEFINLLTGQETREKISLEPLGVVILKSPVQIPKTNNSLTN